MPSIDIDGTPVVFPFKPYDCQLTYIRGVVTALNESKNALLESPTGTGKTLCLLCASLAWQQKNAAAMESQPPPPLATELAYEQTVTDLSRPRQPQQNRTVDVSDRPALPSVVIYASRTHSQLSQVADELKNTVYRPRLSLLGSRDQLCVHEEVSQMKGPAKNHACQALVGARRCKFHRGTESFEQAGDAGAAAGMNSRGGTRGPLEQNTVSDIEELVSLAKKREFCPYYLGRAQAPRAELVLMPYNYLLDAGTRRGIKLNWSNSVVIFDEAHNLENVASEAASFELTSAQVAGAQEEALRCHKIFTEGGGADQEVGSAAQADDALAVKQALHLLEDAMEGVELPSSGGSSSSGRGVTRAGEFIYALFGHAGVTFDTASLWLRKLQDMSDTLQENALYGQANALKLDAVARAIKVAFRGGNASKADCLAFSQMYRAHVAPAETVMASSDGGDKRGRGGVGIGGGRRAGGGAGRVLCFWCFCPGVAMEDLRALGVRSIIITSGTLSPLSSFANELRLPFEVQVENPHVIGPEQAWIGTLGRGVTNVALNSSYANRDNDRYKDELGATLANLCRIVPGGMLVFFSTYRAMNDCVQRWKHYDNGKTWSRISTHKEPVLEPRTAADLKAVMEEYDARIESTGGAVFLAVCRGKVSEGMDFSDGRARCVVVTGIPYAPAMDAKVILKKKYMSEAPLPPGVQRVTGQEWYQQQASRAVNQAIGRVIRHRRDFGCVVLCDSRFAEERNRQSLSMWARPFVRECSGFGRVAADLTRFFKACAANPNLKHVDTITAAPSGPTRLQPQLQPSHARLAAAAGARGALTSVPGSRRGLKSVDAAKGEEEGNDFSRETAADMASKQDVGDIVDSLGGRGRRHGNGGSGSGSEPRGDSGPLGLLQALKASASFVDSAGRGKEAEEPSESDRGVVKLNVGGRRVGDSVGGSRSNSSDPRGGKGWESVPLSQRLARVGVKSASTGISTSAVGGGARPKRQSPGRANSNKNLSGRATGLAGGVLGVVGRSGAGGGTGAEGGDAFGLFSSSISNGSKHGSDGGSKELLSKNTARHGTPPFLSETSDAVEIPEKGSSGRDHQQNGAVLDPQETIITSTISPEQRSTVLPRGDGGSGAQSGSIRRQRLEAFLSDLRKSISRGAYDVFRSRAKAMKEGALEAAETALPALKGVLEVLLLAPPELMLPRRFAQHIPEEHENIYAALLAKKCPGGGMDQRALAKTTARSAEKGDAKKTHMRADDQGVGGTRTAGQHPSGKVRRIAADVGVGSSGGRAGVITSTETPSTGRGGKPCCDGKKLVIAAGADSIRGGKFSVSSPSRSSPLAGAATGGPDSISGGGSGGGGSSKRARSMAGGGTADRTSAATATAAAGVGGGHGIGKGSSDKRRRAVAQLLAVTAPSSDGNDGRNGAAVGRHRNSTRRSIPPP